jgi:polyhydroxybutyrate depolymerase
VAVNDKNSNAMYRYLFSVLFLFAITDLSAQTTVNGSFVHDSITRTYSFYVPASYVPGQPVPLVLNLHGTGTDGNYQALNRDFRPIADTANFIVVHPDGTIEPNLNQRFWNYGNVMSSTVDDVGFLEALIDTISAHYSINQNRVYSVGMSNGGYMSYYLACQSNRFAAIGSVTGSMSNTMYTNCNPSNPTPTIHIHGTSDPINTYTGTSTSKAIEDVTRFWVDQNSCDTIPAIFPLADIDGSDGATAERYLYSNGINGNTVELFKVTGGGHTWPGQYIFTLLGNTCMDFSASNEVWRFFNQYDLVASVETHNAAEFSIYPNPAQDIISIQGNQIITDVLIMDMQGRVVERQTNENIRSIDTSRLAAGNYLVKISGNDFSTVQKIVILSQL